MLDAVLQLAAEQGAGGLNMDGGDRPARRGQQGDALSLVAVQDRGVARGEITRPQAGLAVDLIYGSLWYRLIFHVGPLDYRWADAVAGMIAPAPAPARE